MSNRLIVNGARAATIYKSVRRCYNGDLSYLYHIDIDDSKAVESVRCIGFASSNLELLIDGAAEKLRKSAFLSTIPIVVYQREYGHLSKKEPVFNGVLQYVKKEYRKRRAKMIEEID